MVLVPAGAPDDAAAGRHRPAHAPARGGALGHGAAHGHPARRRRPADLGPAGCEGGLLRRLVPRGLRHPAGLLLAVRAPWRASRSWILLLAAVLVLTPRRSSTTAAAAGCSTGTATSSLTSIPFVWALVAMGIVRRGESPWWGWNADPVGRVDRRRAGGALGVSPLRRWVGGCRSGGDRCLPGSACLPRRPRRHAGQRGQEGGRSPASGTPSGMPPGSGVRRCRGVLQWPPAGCVRPSSQDQVIECLVASGVLPWLVGAAPCLDLPQRTVAGPVLRSRVRHAPTRPGVVRLMTARLGLVRPPAVQLTLGPGNHRPVVASHLVRAGLRAVPDRSAGARWCPARGRHIVHP